jgi:hypothetical protein
MEILGLNLLLRILIVLKALIVGRDKTSLGRDFAWERERAWKLEIKVKMEWQQEFVVPGIALMR